MVHSLCRAGTVSASLLNGNQQANPASGSADDKGMPKAYNSDKAAEKSVNTYRRQRGKQTSFGSQKNVCPKSTVESRISRTDITRLPAVIKKLCYSRETIKARTRQMAYNQHTARKTKWRKLLFIQSLSVSQERPSKNSKNTRTNTTNHEVNACSRQ